jgi:membrane-bound lytic murein transglycosylase D
MQMRISFSHISLAAIAATLLAGLGCQSAKKPATSYLPPKQAAPPPIQAKAAAPAAQVTPSKPSVEPQKTATLQKPAPAPVAQAAPKPDPVQELINKAEAEYKGGKDLAIAGHPDQAKLHFDRAFNTLMGSSADMRSDPRYQKEFDRVLEGVNTLEAASQPPADTVAEQKPEEEEKSEPAPIDEANDVTNYPVDPNLKAKAAAEIKATHSDLPLMMTDQVAGYINFFSTRGRGTLERGLTRSGRYREMIERILKEEGVPQDLIYLAQAESGFHPYAVSRAGARGIWQFMGARARAYDLHRDMWMDERQDPEKSTRAAARHLKDLYNQFGDWYLAMAAYNSGPGTVQSAVKRTGYADFWELYRRNVLPRETRNYVPIIVATTIMVKNPQQYGLEVVPDHPLAYDTLKINYSVSLRLVAECVGATLEDLQDLNPSLLRTNTPKGRFELHVPRGTGEKYQAAIASIPPDMRVSWRYHTVEPGETLMSLSRTYRTPLKTIADANQLTTSAGIESGAKLVIPVASKRGDTQTYAKRLTVYRVRKSDTVQTVSDNLGIPTTTIRRWNRLKGDSLSGRRILYLHLPISPGAVSTQQAAFSKSKSSSHLAEVKAGAPVRHTVKRGETLYSIATNYKTSVAAIKQTNSHVATLRPGMVLIIPAQ